MSVLASPTVAFELPAELEASETPEERGLRRDDVRLLVARGAVLEHRRFAELPTVLERGDLLVVNTSPTLPASLEARSVELVTRLVARGVGFATFTLHTGVASPEAHEPPSAEWYEVPDETAELVNLTRRLGHQVVAVGTTAVRALETVASPDGTVGAGAGWTSLVITPERGVVAVDGLITGWHEPAASHLALIEAVAGQAVTEASYQAALDARYLWHEFGDSHLILREGSARLRLRRRSLGPSRFTAGERDTTTRSARRSSPPEARCRPSGSDRRDGAQP
jgi:S-adenosylmethionine:tRNA-ribosyltransferase-isomerase (queuine synthetase)